MRSGWVDVSEVSHDLVIGVHRREYLTSLMPWFSELRLWKPSAWRTAWMVMFGTEVLDVRDWKCILSLTAYC